MSKAVRNWLLTVYGMVLLMVLVGGITRLTGSGLSMVDWHPLMGALPPLNEEAWLRVFERYQTSPQYQQVNAWMQLEDFKRIFFWEYLHRLLGRTIGLVFALPWLYFVVRKLMSRRLAGQTLVLFAMGGMQGLMGWFMVMSGLVNEPEVSHFRLAAHLMLAFTIAQGCVWLVLSHRPRPTAVPASTARIHQFGSVGFLALTVVQIVYGAFMAGTRAGFWTDTFPKIAGEWFPNGAISGRGLGFDLVSNGWMIQFIHRGLGWAVLIAGLVLGALLLKQEADSLRRRGAMALIAAVGVQFVLGVLTVILGVPIAVGVAHQVGGLVVLTVSVYLVHDLVWQPRLTSSTTPSL